MEFLDSVMQFVGAYLRLLGLPRIDNRQKDPEDLLEQSAPSQKSHSNYKESTSFTED